MKKTLLALAASAVMAVPVITPAQQPDTRTTIAVLPFADGGMLKEYAPLGKGFQALMLNDLATNGRIRVLERDEIQRILDEQKLSASGAVDPASIVRVGKLLGAKFTITGTFITTPGKDMQIVTKVFDNETSEIVYTDKTAMVKAAKFMDLIAAATAAANTKLKLPQLPAGSPAAREASAKVEKAGKMPIETAMLYARAIEAKDSGKPTEARTLFNKVLEQFPKYEPAEKELSHLPK